MKRNYWTRRDPVDFSEELYTRVSGTSSASVVTATVGRYGPMDPYTRVIGATVRSMGTGD